MASGHHASCPLLSNESNEQIESWLAETGVKLVDVFEKHPLERFLHSLYQASHPFQYDYMPDAVLEVYESIEGEFGTDILGIYNKTATLHLMSNIDEIIRDQRVPREFHEELPKTLETTWKVLLETPDKDYVYPGDFYMKDVRILTGRSISYGSRVIDHDVYVRKSIYRNNGWVDNLKCLWFLVTRIRGLGPFYRSHLDHRHMEHRSDEDTFNFRVLMAELLKLNPEVRGTVGSGWLTDPGLAIVSPRYAKRFEEAFGRFVFRRYDGISEETTRQALKKSKTRREAYERGDYQPVSYTTIRARKGLLLRAEKHRRMRET